MSDDIYLMAVPTPREQVCSYRDGVAAENKKPDIDQAKRMMGIRQVDVGLRSSKLQARLLLTCSLWLEAYRCSLRI
jgi:hypothetical protein